MLEPITLPTAMPGKPSNADSTLTTISGAVVPQATIVMPMTMGETRSFRAIETAPRTRNSAPNRSRTNPPKS